MIHGNRWHHWWTESDSIISDINSELRGIREAGIRQYLTRRRALMSCGCIHAY